LSRVSDDALRPGDEHKAVKLHVCCAKKEVEMGAFYVELSRLDIFVSFLLTKSVIKKLDVGTYVKLVECPPTAIYVFLADDML
jgi:hypothetical protein